MADDDRLYFRQLLSGRDFATDDQMARQMVNFVYLIGARATGEAVIVDPAYDVTGLLGVLEADGMRCTGVLATHYHPATYQQRPIPHEPMVRQPPTLH